MIVPNLALLESLDQTVLMSAIVTMAQPATQWMESASANQVFRATGVKIIARKVTLERIATNHANVNLRTTSVTPLGDVFASLDMKGITAQLPYLAFMCTHTQSHPMKMLATQE